MAASVAMTRLQNLGPTGEPIGDVPNAEFVEVVEPDQQARSGHFPPPGHMDLADFWRGIPLPLKLLIGTAPVWFVTMCATLSSAPPPSELTPEQLVAATDMAAVAGGEATSGQPLALDDLADDAPEGCGGKFIWTFNVGGTPGTVSLRDAAGTSVTSGKYQLSEQNLRLTDLVERRPAEGIDAPGKPAKGITYHVGRTPEGRVIIGKKDYRRCTLKTEQTSAAPPVDPPPVQPALHQSVPQPLAHAPPPSLTPDEACEQLSGELPGMIEGNANGAFKVLEASATKDRSRVREDGTLSCYGSVITSRGTIVGWFGTTFTPKGQLLVTWDIDELTTKWANPSL